MTINWLEWKPNSSSVGSVGTLEGESRIISDNPTTQGSKILEQIPPQEPTKPTEPVRSPYFWGKAGDVYGWRLNRAFEVIKRLDYAAGLILWLDTAAPYLYDRLTRSLPDRISRAWDAKVPFDEFDRLCCELEETHGRAVTLYRQYVNRLLNVTEIAGS